MILFIILLLIWAWMIYYYATAPFGQEGRESWIELFLDNESLYAHLSAHAGFYRPAIHYVLFGGLYLWLYPLLNRGGYQWVTGRAWLTLLIAFAVTCFVEWRRSAREGRKMRRAELTHGGLAVAFTHILLGLFNAIF